MTQFQVCGEIIFYVNVSTARPLSRHKRNLWDLPKYKERNSVVSTTHFHELPAAKVTEVTDCRTMLALSMA